MIINMPLPEKVSTNKIYDGTHWSVRSKLKSVYQQSMVPFRKEKISVFPTSFTYVFTFKTRPLDVSNCSYMVKLLEDSMKAHGILPDDDLKHVDSITVRVRKGDTDTVTIISS